LILFVEEKDKRNEENEKEIKNDKKEEKLKTKKEKKIKKEFWKIKSYKLYGNNKQCLSLLEI